MRALQPDACPRDAGAAVVKVWDRRSGVCGTSSTAMEVGGCL